MKLWLLPLVILSGISAGCMSTTVQMDDKFSSSATPSYVDYFDGYLLGFIGHPEVNLQKVCVDQKPFGVEHVKTAEDGFLTIVTLGIYSPSTIKVWCDD